MPKFTGYLPLSKIDMVKAVTSRCMLKFRAKSSIARIWAQALEPTSDAVINRYGSFGVVHWSRLFSTDGGTGDSLMNATRIPNVGRSCCVVAVAIAMLCSSIAVRAGEPQSEISVSNAVLKTIESTTVASQVAGILSSMNASEGMVVTEGQSLGKVRDEAVRLELARLKTATEIAKKKHASSIDRRLALKSQLVAENEYQRAVRANQKVTDTYPINEIDRLKLVADRAKLEVERAVYMTEMAELEIAQAEHEYRKSYEVYSRHQILAPVAGVVTSVEKKVGEWVEPGTDLLRIVRLDRLRIEGFVTAEQSAADLHGREAKVSVALGEGPYETTGKVTFVSPDVNSINSQVRIFLEIDNSGGKLRPGLKVNATISAKP